MQLQVAKVATANAAATKCVICKIVAECASASASLLFSSAHPRALFFSALIALPLMTTLSTALALLS